MRSTSPGKPHDVPGRRVTLATALTLSVFAAACAPARGPTGPVVSPTGIVYEPGVAPVETRASQTATLYLRQDRNERALELALEGRDEDPENPVHWFLAGAAYARTGDLVRADSMFDVAERIYPAYELDVEPQREAAWGQAFNAGLEAYARGDLDRTVESWTAAVAVFDLRVEAHRNLASLLATEGRYDEAIDVYRAGLAGLRDRPATRVLGAVEIGERDRTMIEVEDRLATLYVVTERYAEAEPLLRARLEREPRNVQARSDLALALDALGRQDEARAIYAILLSEEELAETQLFNLGVALFRSAEFAEAAEAFARLTELQPGSRDAWFNYANALFAAEAWDALAAAGDRLVQLEPLGENAHLITARAKLESGDREAALATLERADAAPIYLDGLSLRREGARTSVVGRVIGNAADAGADVRVRFTFYADRGAEVGEETVTLPAPEPGATADFQVSFGMRATAYRYELVG